MYSPWIARRAMGKEIEMDQARRINHIVYMILDKLTRAAQDPTHMDNWDDIQGYASLVEQCLEE